MFPCNYRRLQRFFADFALNEDTLARLDVLLLPRPPEGYTLTLDRTTWYLGKTCLNLLILGIAHQGVAFPVCVIPLSKEGNSNTLERIAILEIFISLFGKACIHCLTADREFIGQAWFEYMRQEGISFRIRVKHNTRIATSQGTMSARVGCAKRKTGRSLAALPDENAVPGGTAGKPSARCHRAMSASLRSNVQKVFTPRLMS